MKKFILFLIIIFSLFYFNTKLTEAKEESPNNRVIIQSDQIIQGPLFKAGKSIYLQGEVDGDVFLVGGEVIVDATISGDLIVVAGQVNIKGNILDDLRLAAGQIDVNAHIEGDVSLAGGQVTLEPGTTINNHLAIAAGLIEYNGQVSKNAWLNSGRIRFNGQAEKDVFINAGTIDVYSDTVINGNLKITYGEKPIISNRAVISGDLIEEKSLPLEGRPSSKNLQLEKSPAVKKITAFFVLQKLMSLTINVLIGWLLITLLPGLAKKLVQISHRQSGSAIGWGFLTLLITPIIGLVFTISLIGIPLGVLTFLYYGFSLYLAQLIAALIIGSHLLKDIKFKKPYKNLALGAIVLALLKLVPILGWITYFILTLFGLGTLTLQEKSVLAKLRKKK